MGGDDLGSDDEFLSAPIRADPNDDSDDENENENDDNGTKDADGATPTSHSTKKRSLESATSSTTSPHLRDEVSTDAIPPKKQKRTPNPLRKLGMEIRTEPLQVQSKLLSDFVGVRFLPHQVAKSENAADRESARARLQGIVSKKKLKKWNKESSPCVLIVCLSARRAVQILKEMAPLNVRAAKLFAKHMDIGDQVMKLDEPGAKFPLAVGTPHRLLALAEQGALSFEHTQCVVLDTVSNDKQFSVYTLPDTVPATKELLRDHVHPECQKRRDIRVAFV